jgi:hypothetical protein
MILSFTILCDFYFPEIYIYVILIVYLHMYILSTRIKFNQQPTMLVTVFLCSGCVKHMIYTRVIANITKALKLTSISEIFKGGILSHMS